MEHHLTTPLSRQDVQALRCGDTVYLSGEVYTARDAAHKRLCALLDEGKPLPFDVRGAVVYYAGPTPARPGEVIGSCGPTTSGRMDAYAPRLLALGLAGMAGKGARSEAVVQAMRALYDKFGWQTNRTISLAYPGADGAQRMADIMAGLRTQPPAQVAGRDVAEIVDYAEGVGDLPKANVVEFRLAGGGKLIVRPSGTEPKIKAYLFAKASDEAGAAAMLDALEQSAREILA